MQDFLVALGLVAVIEGVLYAAAPAAMKRSIRQVLDLPDATVRIVGLSAMTIGVVVVWLVRG
ncbi:DUF2065 domain-containing protein [Chthonobacter rhizosphaerae]|uniref:DUF2065 domain-containing protein n=1 Tax=Chthonobacter rhizosphaerae TaxID=2735553 RepID=UPI0015EE68C5|nr:DUF2065 domain-containing protein [Chthonobacter rhizosphaerae]